MNLFLVEDLPPVRACLREMLGSIPGVKIVGEALGMNEAVSDILRLKPDAVVLDFRLTDGTGFDVLNAMHCRAPHIGLYLLSGFPSVPYRLRAAWLDAKAIFDESRKFEQVRDVLRRRAAALAVA